MGQGEDKIARSLLDLQPTTVLEFYELYPDTLNKPGSVIPIHGGVVWDQPIVWQGREYLPTPIETEGFEVNANGRIPRPRLRIANKDYLITSLLLNNNDFKNAKIKRKRTFLKHLDADNFDGGNPFGEADATAEISNEEYVIGQKTQENKVFVEFELTSPLDLENFEVNHRRILGKYCYWQYRGQGCNYSGPPIQREDFKPFRDNDGNIIEPNVVNYSESNPSFAWNATKTYSAGDVAYLQNDKVLINDINGGEPSPMKSVYVCVSGHTNQNPEQNPTYWQRDGCNKKMPACRLRFNQNPYLQYINSDGSQTQNMIKVTSATNAYLGARIKTVNPQITGVFGDAFTVAGWVRPQSFGQPTRGILQLNDSVDDAFNIFTSGEVANPVRRYHIAYTRGDSGTTGPIDLGVSVSNYHLDHIALVVQPNKVRDPSNAFSFINPYIKVIINGNVVHEYNGGDSFLDNINCLALGVNEYNAITRTASNGTTADYWALFGDIGPWALWSRPLLDSEIDYLRKSVSPPDGKTNDFTHYPRPYTECTGDFIDLTGDSNEAWWDATVTTTGGHPSGMTDTLSGDALGLEFIDVTGYVEDYDLTYYTLGYGAPVITETSEYLPFGGFPGTDGFNYGKV